MYPTTDSEKGRNLLARYKEYLKSRERDEFSTTEYIHYLREKRIAEFHGNHDQKDHGNWARGGSAVPVEERKVLRSLDPEVRGIVQELLTARRKAEPRYTKTLSDIAAAQGGEMYGLDFKFKKAEGIAEKIDRKVKDKGISAKKSAESIGDALRYTIAYPPERYTEGMRAAIKGLLDEGVRFESIEDNWQKGDAYNGVNVSMIDPDTGLRMELQFHTPQSFDVKDRVIHKDYEFYRSGKGTRQQRWAAADRMQKHSDAIAFPPERLGSEVEGVPVQKVYRPHTEPITAAAKDQTRIPVSTIDKMEDLYEKGIASQDDWEEFVDYWFGYTSFWPGYIYPNVDNGNQEELAADTEEFYNHCNSPADGKFCPGPDGPGRLRDQTLKQAKDNLVAVIDKYRKGKATRQDIDDAKKAFDDILRDAKEDDDDDEKTNQAQQQVGPKQDLSVSYVDYLRLKAVEFHGTHNQQDHGNWADGNTQADPLGDQIASEIAAQREQRGQKPLSPGSMKVYVSKERSRRKSLESVESTIKAKWKALNEGNGSLPLKHANSVVKGQYPRKEVGVAVRSALETINKVIGLPDDAIPIPVKTNSQMTAQASYGYRDAPSVMRGNLELPALIEVNPKKSEHMALSFTHEFGHYVESSITGRIATDPSPAATHLLDTMIRSKAYQNLQGLARNAPRRVIADRARYYMTPHETFARAFAQWVGLRSRDSSMMQEANDVLTATKPGYDLEVYNYSQWHPTDFEPIAQAMDAYFEEKGLKR